MIERILVVDDDFLIRKWLCLLIQQSQKCHAKLFQAENGQKALNLLNQEAIDLVITDVKMPLVNGVDLVRQIQKMSVPPQIAVLSAYDDYNYVRATLKEGVLDYLLKGEIELHDIDALLDQAEQRQASTLSLSETRLSKGTQSYNKVIAKAFRECLEDPEGDLEGFLKQSYRNKIVFPMESLACYLKHPQRSEAARFHTLSQLENICNSQKLDYLLLPYPPDLFFLLYSRQAESEAGHFSEKMLWQIREALGKTPDSCTVTTVNRSRIPDVQHLRQVFSQQIDDALRISFYQLGQLPAKLSPEQELTFLAAFKEEISAIIRKKQYSNVRGSFQDMVVKCRETAVSPKLFINSCIAVCYQLSAYVQFFTSNAHLALVEDTVFQLQRVETAQESERHMLSLMDYIHDVARKHPRDSPAIEKSIDYIAGHYSEKLSLDEISSYVYLNKSYFSELFKKEIGINYNDYINQVRIQRACELMAEGRYTLSDIAQMVGFSDQNYFSKVFKRIVGESPKRYQKALKHNS